MTFRALASIALAVSLSGCCSTPSTTFLVERDGNNPVVYRPGTSKGPENVTRLYLPWVDVSHCTDRALKFKLDGDTWSVKSPALSGTFAELPEAMVKALVKGEQGLRKIIESKVETDCQVQVKSDVPYSLRNTTNGMALLMLLVAERLPMHSTEAWKDQYDYDPDTQSLNILPGMRLRLNHETAVVTDATRTLADSKSGALASPVYLQLLSVGDNGAGSWTPTLAHMKFAARDLHSTANRPWFSVSGINDLAAEQPRFWRLYVPKRLLPPCINPYTVNPYTVNPDKVKEVSKRNPRAMMDGNCSETSAQANGVLNITESLDSNSDEYGAFMLVGADDRASMVNLINRVHADQKLTEACQELLESGRGSCFVFRYRASLVPEIPVTIQGEQEWIEVGTTLRNLVQTRAARRLRDYLASPTREASNAYAELGKALQEELLLDVLREASLTRRFSGLPVRIEPQRSSDLPALLDINIQMGDEITWQRSSDLPALLDINIHMGDEIE